MKTEILERVLADRDAKRQFALVTDLATGDQSIVHLDGAEDGGLDPALRRAVEELGMCGAMLPSTGRPNWFRKAMCTPS
jgi:hypothetical protein